MPTIAAVSTVASETILDASDAASDVAVSSSTSNVDQQITVVLDGVIYDAVVLPHFWAAEVAAEDQAYGVLLDGDYRLNGDAPHFAGSRLTLRATFTGDSIVASPTTAGDDIAPRLPEDPHLEFGASPNLLICRKYPNISLAERGPKWVAHSTRDPISEHATITVRSSTGRIFIPTNIALTRRVLESALGKLQTHQIEETVEILLEILDGRNGDPDLEIDADSEDEVGEESAQAAELHPRISCP